MSPAPERVNQRWPTRCTRAIQHSLASVSIARVYHALRIAHFHSCHRYRSRGVWWLRRRAALDRASPVGAAARRTHFQWRDHRSHLQCERSRRPERGKSDWRWAWAVARSRLEHRGRICRTRSAPGLDIPIGSRGELSTQPRLRHRPIRAGRGAVAAVRFHRWISPSRAIGVAAANHDRVARRRAARTTPGAVESRGCSRSARCCARVVEGRARGSAFFGGAVGRRRCERYDERGSARAHGRGSGAARRPHRRPLRSTAATSRAPIFELEERYHEA